MLTLCNLYEYTFAHCIDLTSKYKFVWSGLKRIAMSSEKYLPLNCLYFSFLLLFSLFIFFLFVLPSFVSLFLSPFFVCACMYVKSWLRELPPWTDFLSFRKICSAEAIVTQTHRVNTKLIASEAKLMAQSTRSKPLKNRIAYTRTHLGHILFKRVFLSSVVNKIRK